VAEQTAQVSLRVNGIAHEVEVPVRRLLSDTLRHDLRLTGTHVGCEHGVCGACTVLLDGEPVRSCLLLAVSVAGHDITTVEGCCAEDGSLGPVQQAFRDCHGLQCGFCTPGFITTITAYLREHPAPTVEEAREAIAGNLCRCTGYVNIVAAVMRASELLGAGDGPMSSASAAPEDGDARSHPGTSTRRPPPSGSSQAGDLTHPAGHDPHGGSS
jgi:carbon-monoxide dehydrogenase small subunit